MATDPTRQRREIRGYHAVRAAAKDYANYSSDLLGDRDVRNYRQLPLEADPPRHTLFREALQPIFMSAAIEPHAKRFEELALSLIRQISAKGGGDVVEDLALPYVIGCLTIIYGRPQDYDEWLSWGSDVWTAEAHSRGELTIEARHAQRDRSFSVVTHRSGAVLEEYLNRVFDQAEERDETEHDRQDIWDKVAHMTIAGIQVTRDEMKGIANVLLAGGRDTVIKLITGLTWYLIRTPTAREFLTQNEAAFNLAIAEMARYLSPLPKMERVLPEDKDVPDEERDPQRYVLLSFVSANFDRSVWPVADVIDFQRERRPHLAFGFGRHSCLGMNITEHESKAFLRALLTNWPGWQLDGEPEIDWTSEGEGSERVEVIGHFLRVPVTVASNH